MSAHTSGEWFSREDDAGNWEIRDAQGNWIARVHFRNGPSEPEAAANAALVIAAPEMAEALKEIAKGEGPFSVDRLTHATNVIEHAKELARAALAKAGVKP